MKMFQKSEMTGLLNKDDDIQSCTCYMYDTHIIDTLKLIWFIRKKKYILTYNAYSVHQREDNAQTQVQFNKSYDQNLNWNGKQS